MAARDFSADAVLQFVDTARQHQHQRDRQFGAGNIGASTNGEHGDSFGGARRAIDAAQIDAVFLHRFEMRRGRDLGGAKRKPFDDQRLGVGKVSVQLILCFDHSHLGRIKPLRLCAHPIAPAIEIGLIMREKIRIGSVTLAARIRIKNELYDTKKTIVFDDDDIWHGAYAFSCDMISIDLPIRPSPRPEIQ